ncbi:MAG: sigma-54-dependent Fis family transcriptional regulator [Deltaproteobacteria bacterium]|nr:sigma-54-dependent Fis family transcriptional regulator [Deltaproteobacteria bacterium]
MFKVLVVDDDGGLRLTVSHALGEANYQVEQAQDGEEAVNKIRARGYDLVLMDVNMPRLNGLEALKQVKAYDPSIIVIVLTAYANIRDAIEAIKEGAYNYLEKPVKAENLVCMIDRALKAHSMVRSVTFSAPVVKLPGGTTFVGQSNEMKKIFNVIDKLSRVDTAVLIRGESGTGKELVANAVHFNGPRKDERFVTVNCSAIPETLIESEFFGHEKGAFTGADSRKIGKFQYADGGTLFLDEIGDISAGMQVKLLRVLQEKRFTPVGANREVEVNVRIIAATNRNLEDMIKKGEFREDLYYRLNVLPIYLPPLRERKDDIVHLAKYFIGKFNQIHRKNITEIRADAMEILKACNWPGNIRELENVIEHSFVIETSTEITPQSLPENIAGLSLSSAGKGLPAGLTENGRALLSDDDGELPKLNPIGFRLDINKLDFQANKEAFEREFLINALKAFNGRINQTAIHANIPKKTLLRKLEKYGISAKDYIL